MASHPVNTEEEPRNWQLTPDEEPTIGRLVTEASRDVSALIQKEIQLAKSELKVSVRAGGMSIAFFAAAVFLAVLMIVMLSVTIAYFIHWNGSGLSLHWAFLIVTGFWLLLAAIFALLGIRKIKQVGPPEKAIEHGREIPKAIKGSSSADRAPARAASGEKVE